MNSVRDVLHGRASQIAAATSPLAPDAVASIAGSAGRARRKRVAMTSLVSTVGILVIAAVAYAVLPRDNDLSPIAPTDSATPSATPSTTPSATPSNTAVAPAIVEGFAPVPQLPASEIPWGAVGPGWFALDYSDPVDISMAGDSWAPTSQLEGGVSLVSPDGTWYAAQPHTALGNGPAIAWDGTSLWMVRETASNMESVLYHLELVNGRTAATQTVPGEGAGRLFPFADGSSLYYAWGGDGIANSVVAVDKTDETGGCSDAGSGLWAWDAADMSFLYNPSTGGLVCFGPAAKSDKTVVTSMNVTSLTETKSINTLKLPPWFYTFLGWIDDDTFYFARLDLATGVGTDAVFRYDLRDDSITPVDLHVYDDLNDNRGSGYYDAVSKRHIVAQQAEDGWYIDLYDADGGAVASLTGACAPDKNLLPAFDFRTSGGRLMVTCPASGTVTLFDLADGRHIGKWELPGERRAMVLDAPDS